MSTLKAALISLGIGVAFVVGSVISSSAEADKVCRIVCEQVFNKEHKKKNESIWVQKREECVCVFTDKVVIPLVKRKEKSRGRQ
jgi:hypothetical protein